MAATEKAKLLQAAKLKKKLTQREIAALINAERPRNDPIAVSSISFALAGKVGKDDYFFHGLEGDQVTLLVAKALGVPRKAIFAAHEKDKRLIEKLRADRAKKREPLRKQAEVRRKEILQDIENSGMKLREGIRLSDVIRNLDYQAILALESDSQTYNRSYLQLPPDLRERLIKMLGANKNARITRIPA